MSDAKFICILDKNMSCMCACNNMVCTIMHIMVCLFLRGN